MKHSICLLLISVVTIKSFVVNAQGLGINSSGVPADPSAILDASSTTKGTLITRMTTTQRNSITSPAEGLQIFNTTTKCFEAYVLNAWNIIACPGCVTPATPAAGVYTPSTTQIAWNWNTVSGA